MRRLLPLLVLLAACSTKNKEPAPVASSSAAVVSSAPSAAAAASSAPTGPEADVKKVVRAWNDALDKHDVAALEPLYGDPVFFYTKPQPKKTVLAAKKSALGPKSTFHQKIMDEIVVAKTDKGWSATFTKQSGNGARLGETKALLVLSADATDAGPRSALVITEERDAPSTASACGAAATAVVHAIPAVKKLMDDTRKELAKDPKLVEGGTGPATMDDGTIVGDWGVFHPENFERVLSWTVYPNGRLDVRAGAWFTTDPSGQTMDSEKATKLSEDDRKKVTVACGPPADSHTGGEHH